MKRSSRRPSSATAISESGKTLHGTAAQLRLTRLAGGWDKQQHDLIERVVTETVDRVLQKVLAHRTLVAYGDSPAQKQENLLDSAVAGARKTAVAVTFHSEGPSHGFH